MDDTLYLESSYQKSGFRYIDQLLVEREGVDGFYDLACRLYDSGDRKNIFSSALDKLGFSYDDDFIKKLVHEFRSHFPAIELLQESIDILKLLRPTFRLGVITDGYEVAQSNKVKALGLEKYFEKIIINDKFGRSNWKPAPFSYISMENFFNVSPEKCIYVGDNPNKDFVTANERGWMTVQILRKNRVHDFPTDLEESYYAKAEIESLSDIKKYIM